MSTEMRKILNEMKLTEDTAQAAGIVEQMQDTLINLEKHMNTMKLLNDRETRLALNKVSESLQELHNTLY